jgi:hypothetical protein
LYFIDTRERLEPFDSQIEPEDGRKRVEGYRRVFWYFDFIIHRRKARVFDPVVDLEIGIETLFLFWGRLLFRSRLFRVISGNGNLPTLVRREIDKE